MYFPSFIPAFPLNVHTLLRLKKKLVFDLWPKYEKRVHDFYLNFAIFLVPLVLKRRRGARGLGWNMSQALAEAGAKAIALLDVKQELGDRSAAELHRTTGILVQFYKVDVRDAKAISEVVGRVNQDLGAVDIVINSAGVVEYGGSHHNGRPVRLI